ncbi:Uncharacterised protein [Leminorella richardii]|uniref:DUF4250 domain-containing protein n=1 Tax=Leminorella richardii TaxID=158841 RepID=A0A2X4XXJ2_9GAMM|nr:DUF4250 domain-containing protein [Leminorella richardii]SQI41294.1 Uncharacterised protein [Leminorella richardii]
MPLSRFSTMDPNMLLSIVNMKLRDQFDSLNELALSYDIDADALSQKLQEAGYYYQAANNQFVQI